MVNHHEFATQLIDRSEVSDRLSSLYATVIKDWWGLTPTIFERRDYPTLGFLHDRPAADPPPHPSRQRPVTAIPSKGLAPAHDILQLPRCRGR